MRVVFVFVIALVLPSCAGSQGFDARRALVAEGVDIQLDSSGQPVEIEYRIPPQQVPDAIKEAMNRLHPGSEFLGARVELRDGEQHFELERQVAGLSVAAVFRVDGSLVRERLQLDTTRVPSAVHETVRRTFPRGQGFVFHMRRNEQQQLVEYRVQLTQDGLSYEAAIYANGHRHRVWRQVSSEIGVPVEMR